MDDPIAETDAHFRALEAVHGFGHTMLDSHVPQPVGTMSVPIGGGNGSDSLIDHAISARQNFESQRAGLIDSLGRVGNRRQMLQIQAQLHGIDQGEHALDWESAHRMQAAHEYNAQHDRELTLQRRADIDEQGSYLMSAVANLDNLLHRGAIDHDAYNDGVLKAMQQYPMGIENPAAAKHLDYTVQRSDRLADFKSRLDMRNAAKSTSKLAEKVEQDLMSKTGLTKDEFASIPASSVRAGKFVDAQGTEVPMGHVGGSFTNQYHEADKGPVVEIDTETGPLHMTRGAYDRYRRVFGSDEPSGGTQQADPRAALAQKALDDPNASEAHKAAAKQILGIK